jgi:copper homeostasis protein
MASPIIELCSQNINDAISKSKFVHQIEFCSQLSLDGLSPALDDVIKLSNQVAIPIKVMIRHRSGDFIYNSEDFNVLLSIANNFISNGFNRLVFGASLPDGRLDLSLIKEFCNEVYPSKVCIHKAIDISPNIFEDFKGLLSIENINEVLTSGGKSTALEGCEVINKMVNLAGQKCKVIAAGSIRQYNLADHISRITAPIFHGRLIV